LLFLCRSISFLHGQEITGNMDSDALNTFLIGAPPRRDIERRKGLHRTQPAILAAHCAAGTGAGHAAVRRVAGRTVLSDAGRVMVPYAERAVGGSAGCGERRSRAGAAGFGPVLRSAVVGTLAGGQLSEIMKRFAREHPDVNLSLPHRNQRRMSDLIRRGGGHDRAAL